MVDEAVRDLVWDSLYMADVRARYFSSVSGRLRRSERLLALLVAIVSSGSVVALMTGLLDMAPMVLSLTAAVAAAVLAAFKFDKRVSVAASLSRQWSEIASEYEILWSQIKSLTDDVALQTHRELERKHFPADELAIAEFQLNKNLLDDCFNEVAVSRGLLAAA